ncbi:MAG: tRNA uridine-5-carboxymethylaminomethyl(34) synthesis enzyme MnmG [Phycisphaerales bacterium]|nr:tRNA uridine-5-carboxymethylaminomethyl(34) synthesis enzyme MnmG [Phycisphaerales bacterium]
MTGPHYDIIVIGAGHAGAEAAWAGANLGACVALITLDPATIGVMSCNPAIGGLAKGQIVREVDALGGLMALAADAAGIQFRILNTSKGAAVHGPRAQCDKHAYAEHIRRLLASRSEITIHTGRCDDILVSDERVRGIMFTNTGGEQQRLDASAVVLTTGTFMRGLMHTGHRQTPGGRHGEDAAIPISDSLRNLGFDLGRLKTGTPPRLRRSTIDWDALEPQFGDSEPTPFSDLTDPASFPFIEQVECRAAATNARIHDLIRANLDRAPMYTGQIETTGPRYCPSIEDKVVRFPDRQSHHVFLEPESLRDDWIYCNGISTSLPADVQDAIVRNMAGCARAEILRYGYAIEYDVVRTHQIDSTCMTKLIEGLFLAGQINGTSGYEEAAGQGLIAGLNAVRFTRGEPLVTLGRDQAYIGVMLDDLVLKNPIEPYRMFTSRAEHRLLLRADNAADRLTPWARRLGLVSDMRWARYQKRRDLLDHCTRKLADLRIDSVPLRSLIHHRGFDIDTVAAALGIAHHRGAAQTPERRALFTAVVDCQYEGYLVKQHAQIKKHREMERWRLPVSLDYDHVTGLRTEARAALARYRPATLGQAGRLEGVNPADITLLAVAIKRTSTAPAP